MYMYIHVNVHTSLAQVLQCAQTVSNQYIHVHVYVHTHVPCIYM